MVSKNEIRELEDRRSFMEKMKNPELIEKAPEKSTEQEVQKEILEEMNRMLKK